MRGVYRLAEEQVPKRVKKEEQEPRQVKIKQNAPLDSLFRRLLTPDYLGQLVVVEYESPGFIHRSTGILDLVGHDYIELAPSDQGVDVNIYGSGFGFVESLIHPGKLLIPLRGLVSIQRYFS